MRRFLSVLVLLLSASGLAAQDLIPDRRASLTLNTDYPGGDFASFFDTTRSACIRACLSDRQCLAFTFNETAGACFLKSEAGVPTPFTGATSGLVFDTDPAQIAAAPDRAAELDFLRDSDFAGAFGLAETIHSLHSTGGNSFATMIDAINARRDAADWRNGLLWVGAAVTIADRSQLWTDYAEFALRLTDNTNDQRNVRARALPATINGYLRAQTDFERVRALEFMAEALEDQDRGRAALAAMELATQIAPNPALQVKLDRLTGLYGFGIVDTRVEANAASPRICVQFNAELVQAGVDYEPYVGRSISTLTVEVSGDEICVLGMNHGERHRLVFRAGLPAATGETLPRDAEIVHYVRDRAPRVSFPGRGYVLPSEGPAALPVETVNTGELELTLYRVSDRSLLRAMDEGLFSAPLSVWGERYFKENIAEEVWTGSAEIAGTLNQETTTRLPMEGALEGLRPGIYTLTARSPDQEDYFAPATQWFVVSDIGLATFSGVDGLTVVARGLGDAQPMGAVDLTLISQSNSVLGTATTDAEGAAVFAPGLTRGTGGAQPALLVARDGAGDLTFLPLDGPAFDLSDRGVEGRDPAPAMDVFLATDRGAYRPGEVIHLTALLRDEEAAALVGVPLTAILYRPDGVEYDRITSTASVAGGHVFSIPVATTAPRGTWRVELKVDQDAPALAVATVLVEDFVPERIDYDITLAEGAALGDTLQAEIDAVYLYGPPAVDLAVEGEYRVVGVRTHEDFPGYLFGRYDERFFARTDSIPVDLRTDSAGTVSIPILLEPNANADRPLRLALTTRIAEGSGRPVERQAAVSIGTGQPMIGIRPVIDGVVPLGETAEFQLIALDLPAGQETIDATWTVNRIQRRYQWYQVNGNWTWDPITRKTPIETGSISIGSAPVTVGVPVDWGWYEIRVEAEGETYVISSQDFYAGWYAPVSPNETPDVLTMSLDAEAYSVGDTAELRVVPRDAGTALVTVLTNRVVHREMVEVTEGENLIPLAVTDEWGAGAYVTVSVVRPMDVGAGRNPARSLGLAYASVDPGDAQLAVALEMPDQVRPRGPLEIAVKVDGVQPGETAYVTVAAIDVGVLNLTGFETPDPADHYFGQRRLGVELRDLYGRLIDGLNGNMGVVRSGGDDLALEMVAAGDDSSPPPTEDILAFFTGPVEVGPDGYARVTFDLPAFGGTLRVMAVAWSETGVGGTEAEVLVRDPVVLATTLPRFLAPGDESTMRLELTHVEGPTGTVAVSVVPDGVDLLRPGTFAVTLSEGGREVVELPILAFAAGDHEITVNLTLPNGQTTTQTYRMPVRTNDPEVTERSRFTLAPGSTFRFDDNVFASFQRGSGTATLTLGPLARFDAPGLLATLDRYPYGCTEQMTSRALPLLYFNQVASALDLDVSETVEERVDQAIASILANQSASGSFGLWRPSSGDLWLDAYVTDFLSRAKARGFEVSDLAFRSALDNLRNAVNTHPDFEDGGQGLAYALMVLAREGSAQVGDLRYYADVKAEDFATPLAQAQLGAALAFYGDQARADAMFRRASEHLGALADTTEGLVWRADYGSYRRDAAAVLTLAAEAGSDVIDRDRLARIVARTARRLSTQEAVWSLMATDALIGDARAADVLIDGVPAQGPLVRVLDAQTSDGTPVAFTNNGDTAIEMTLTTFGVPVDPLVAGGEGYAIARDYYTLDGTQVDPSQVTVGTRLVVVLRVTPFEPRAGRLMVDDPLPAGFEIDNPSLIQSGDIQSLSWLDTAYPQSQQFRTDRFLAAVDWNRTEPFQLAYMVRAVSPGSFHHPAASVEDMYRPELRANTDAGRVTVTLP